MKIFRILLFVFSLLFYNLTASAQQDDRKTEAYYLIEAAFIEAGNLVRAGKIEEGIEKYKSLLSEPEAVGAVWFELSRIYEVRNEDEAAVKAAKSAVDDEPNNQWYQKQLGDLYQKIGDDESAAEVYGRLAAQHPNNDYYYFKQAYFLVRANETSKAMKIYDDMEGRFGINEELSRRRHTLYLGLGDKKKAEREILKLTETYPQNLDYRYFLAGFYEQNQEKAKARKVYEYIISQNPNDSQAMIALAEERQPASDEAGYLAELKEPFSNPDLAIDAKIAQIIPLIQKVANENNRSLADELLQLSAILEEVHDDAKAYSIAGDLYYYTDRKAEAIEKYEATLQRNETVLLVWEQYLSALAETGDYKKLLSRSEDALDVFPNQGRIHLLNAVGYGRTGKHAQALNGLQQAGMMSFNNPPLEYDILVEKGEQYFYLKKYKEANESFQKAIDMNPQGAEGLARYAYFAGKQLAMMSKEDLFTAGLTPKDLTANAEKTAAKANELMPNKAEYQAAYAMVYYGKKEYKKAVTLYAKAVENMQFSDARLLEDYGDALLRNGNADEAVVHWKKALEAGGNATRLNKKITEKEL